MKLQATELFDSAGTPIRAGDTLYREFLAPSENGLRQNIHWIEYQVGWSGSCLVAVRGMWSSSLPIWELGATDKGGFAVVVGQPIYYLDEEFESGQYLIVERR